MLPLLRAGFSFSAALKVTLAADTVMIAITGVVNNLMILVILGAMAAGLASLLFGVSLALALLIAGAAAFPVNPWLIARGKGHAVVHTHH